MPMSIVTINPPGSLPGVRNLATAPTTSPINTTQSQCINILRSADAWEIQSPSAAIVYTVVPGRMVSICSEASMRIVTSANRRLHSLSSGNGGCECNGEFHQLIGFTLPRRYRIVLDRQGV